MPSILKLKYEKMHFRVHLKDGESLGLIVSTDWKHRYMIVKGVRPDSPASRLGITRGDRLFAIDDFIGQQLTMKVMDIVLKTKRRFVLTVLRKKSLCSSKPPLPPPAPQKATTTVKGTRLDFGNVSQTYCLKSANTRPFTIYQARPPGMEHSRRAEPESDESDEVMDIDDLEAASQKCETCGDRTEEERDWDAVSNHTCLSEQIQFERQRYEQNTQPKMCDITNKFGDHNSSPSNLNLSHYSYYNPSTSIIQADLSSMQQRGDKGEQFVRRHRVANMQPGMINRVSDWVVQHSSFNNSSGAVCCEENKENIMPTNIWMNSWKHLD